MDNNNPQYHYTRSKRNYSQITPEEGSLTPPRTPPSQKSPTGTPIIKSTPERLKSAHSVPSSATKIITTAEVLDESKDVSPRLKYALLSSSVTNTTKIINELLCIFSVSKHSTKAERVRKLLQQKERNPQQMTAMWGPNITYWAKTDHDAMCFLCRQPITFRDRQESFNPQVEHKFPSVMAHLNVPPPSRIPNNVFNNWNNYINDNNNISKLKELYELINGNNIDYDENTINFKFNELFDDANIPKHSDSDINPIYWRNILKFWMLELAYSHERCNQAKNSYQICGNITYYPNKMKTYDKLYTKMLNSVWMTRNEITKESIKTSRNLNKQMFKHLNNTLNDVQQIMITRTEITNIDEDKIRQAIALTNLKYYLDQEQLKSKQNELKQINNQINNHITTLKLYGKIDDDNVTEDELKEHRNKVISEINTLSNWIPTSDQIDNAVLIENNDQCIDENRGGSKKKSKRVTKRHKRKKRLTKKQKRKQKRKQTKKYKRVK
jgi:hypothetical protein